MNPKARILVVDDAADNRLLLKMLLEDDYDVIEADSGESCLSQVNQQLPDLILLDITMPGMSGYEVCVHLRKQKETEHLPIIFVSALVGAEQRLEGFEAGADDYLTKPVDAESLFSKISACLTRQQSLVAAQSDASEAMRIAMEAMTTSSELGQIVQFVKNVQTITTPQEVGEAIQTIAKEFCLSTSVMVTSGAPHFVGCTADSIEAKVLKQVSNSSERMVSIGIRTIIRNEHVTLLIKNMPLDDENRCGRLKDHLAVLMDIANGHLITLEAQESAAKQRKHFLGQVIRIAEEQTKKTSGKLHEHHNTTQTIIEGMISSLESMLFGLGLDDDQEKKLMQLANHTSLQLQEASRATEDLDKELGVVVESLYEFMQQED